MKKVVLFLACVSLAILGHSQCKTIVYPNNVNAYNDQGSCNAIINYTVPYVYDSCSSGFFEDFESGHQGWIIGAYTSVENWVIQDFTGTGTMLSSNMMGVPHSGNYSFGGTEYSYIQSPVFNTTGGGTISFDYFVNNEPAFHDKEIVEISFDAGANWLQIGGDQLTNHPTNIQTYNFSILPVDGSSTTVIRFTYNTIDACCGAQDGFFIDNVKFEQEVIVQQITGLGSGSSFPIGTTIETFEINQNGALDTVSFNVTVSSTYNTSQSLSICHGESVYVGVNSYSSTGNYIDTLTTQSGCDSIVTTNLTVKPQIDTTLNISNNLITSNEFDASYQWINCPNNNIITGETNQEFIANNSGSYAVIITQNGCSKISETATIISTEIANFQSEISEILVYPNPTTEKIFLSINDYDNNYIISIVNVSGKEILNKIVVSEKTEIDLSKNTSGVYFLRVSNNEKSETLKIVKN